MLQEKKNILIILSDHESRVKLRSTYEEMGHFVLSTGTAVDALKLLQDMSAPNLIITGGKLPMISVSQFMRILKEENSRIPVALLKCDKAPLEGACYVLDLASPKSLQEALNHCT